MNGRSSAMECMRRGQLSWDLLHCARAWCKFRAGLHVLKHIGKRCSMARIQKCIFCDANVRNSVVHVLAVCSEFSVHREAVTAKLNNVGVTSQTRALRILVVLPGSAAFEGVLRWMKEIDCREMIFWK